MSANPLYAELDAIQSQMQTIINQAQITSLESCKAHLQRCLDYLEGRDDCLDLYIERAAHHACRAVQAIDEHLDEGDEDAEDLFREMKRDDDKMRAADIRAEQRR